MEIVRKVLYIKNIIVRNNESCLLTPFLGRLELKELEDNNLLDPPSLNILKT
jgi:hypothetical protein